MLSYLDPIIFPNRCEILEIIPSQRYVYPIFKNGSSSLHSNYKTISQTQVADLKVVDVYVRDPMNRFLTGVQTYIDNLQKSDPTIDRNTVLYFVNEYLFLNRHYAPQFHWIVNLQRFTKAQIRILPLSELSQITTAFKNKQSIDDDVLKLSNNPKIQFYTGIDKVLTDTLIGQTVDFKTILRNIDSEIYQEIIEYSKSICGVLE